MKERLKNNKEIIVYIVLMFSVFGVFMITKAGLTGDDNWFRDTALSMPLSRFIRERYLLWSSRVLIEALEYFFAKHVFLWKILTALIYTTGMYLMSRMIGFLFEEKLSLAVNIFFAAVLYALPKGMFYGAGWVSTTINYIWTVSGLIAVTFFMFKLYREERLKIFEYIICTMVMIFVVNQEISCAVLLVLIFLFAILYISKYKKVNPLFFILLVLDIAGIVNVLLCPGNDLRMIGETANWFPDFNELSLVTKLELGFSSTMQNFNTPIEPFGLLFFGFVFFAAFVCIKEPLYKIIGVAPVVILVIFNVIKFDNLKIPPHIFEPDNPFLSTGTNPTFSQPRTLIPDILFIIQLICVIIVLIKLFEKEKGVIIALLAALCCGFMSRMAMSFSPTIWVSGIRTFAILYIALAFCIGVLGVKVYKKNRFFLLFVSPFVIFGMINNII